MNTSESENDMTEITYAHLNCFYCESLSGEAEDEAVRTPAARAAQVGFDDHWARYEKTTKEKS